VGQQSKSLLNRKNTGFLLAKALQRWNGQLYQGFSERGYAQVRPSYGSVLVPLFEEDGLRIGELAKRSKLSKQTMTTMVRLLERDALISRKADVDDYRATRVFLTPLAKRFRPIAESVLSDLEGKARRLCSRSDFDVVRKWLGDFADS